MNKRFGNEFALAVFSFFSEWLRKTPLRRSAALGWLHDRLYRGLSNKTVFTVRDEQIELDIRDRIIAKDLELYGHYEKYVGDILLRAVRPGSVAIDIGANVGLHTIPLARRVGMSGEVIAFEPDPDNAALLRKNLERNSITNVRVREIGLSDKAGSERLFQSAANRGSLSLRKANVADWEDKRPDSIQVRLRKGDDELADIRAEISVIKIDVEGAESLVLRGLSQTLDRFRDIKLVFEFWPRMIEAFGVDPSEFLGALEHRGFQLRYIDERNCRTVLSTSDELLRRGLDSENALNIFAER